MIVLLNPVLNCFKSVLSFSFDKVTTGTYNFTSVILNVPFVGEVSLFVFVITLLSKLEITQFQTKLKSKTLHNQSTVYFKVLQKLLKYFNGTAISTSFLTDLFAS